MQIRFSDFSHGIYKQVLKTFMDGHGLDMWVKKSSIHWRDGQPIPHHFPSHPLKPESCHDANFVVTGATSDNKGGMMPTFCLYIYIYMQVVWPRKGVIGLYSNFCNHHWYIYIYIYIYIYMHQSFIYIYIHIHKTLQLGLAIKLFMFEVRCIWWNYQEKIQEDFNNTVMNTEPLPFNTHNIWFKFSTPIMYTKMIQEDFYRKKIH